MGFRDSNLYHVSIVTEFRSVSNGWCAWISDQWSFTDCEMSGTAGADNEHNCSCRNTRRASLAVQSGAEIDVT
jgi:hypothetical protein